MADAKEKPRRKNTGSELVARKAGGKGGEILAPEKGQRPAGRKKGTPNLFTREIKDALIAAGNTAGDIVCTKSFKPALLDRFPGLKTLKEHGGLHGYLVHLAIFNDAAFASLLGKAMPIQLISKDEEQRVVVYRTFKEVQEALKQQGLLVDLASNEFERKG